jgi:S1-C subfamily serine protease
MSTANNRASSRSWVPTLLLYGLLLVAAGVLLWRYFLPNVDLADLTRPAREKGGDPTAQPHPIAKAGPMQPDEQANINIYTAAKDSVVNVTTATAFRNRMTLNVQLVPRGTGSGFVWDDKGRIVTNYHVIKDANQIRVTLANQKTYKVYQANYDADKDLAVLWTDAPRDLLKPLPIGESGKLMVGQKTYAIGNPFGLDHTLTTGIVSALGREIEAENGRVIKNVIQTDAAINPGNSGGPLLDSSGRIIGVTSAILSPSGANSGIGFAIPVDVVNRVIPQLIRFEKRVRPTLGISIAPDQLARNKGIEGVLVIDTVAGGPAETAGIRPTRRNDEGEIQLGDIITAVTIGDQKYPIKSSDDLYAALDEASVGQTVTLTVRRGAEIGNNGLLNDGQTQTVDVTLGADTRTK